MLGEIVVEVDVGDVVGCSFFFCDIVYGVLIVVVFGIDSILMVVYWCG